MVAVFKGLNSERTFLIRDVGVRLEEDNSLSMVMNGSIVLHGCFQDHLISRSYVLPRRYSSTKVDSLIRYVTSHFKSAPLDGIIPGFSLVSPRKGLMELNNPYRVIFEGRCYVGYGPLEAAIALAKFSKKYNYRQNSEGVIISYVEGAPEFVESDLSDLSLMEDEVLAFISYLAEQGDVKAIRQLLR